MTNPSGLCMCGCGQKTTIARHNDASSGRVKGQPIRFINGHQSRVLRIPVDVDRVPPKLCECGCGQYTKVALETCTPRGIVVGQRLHYVRGHNGTKKPLELTWWFYVGPHFYDDDACWRWWGVTSSVGYGYFQYRNQCVFAHRLSYELHFGPIPESYFVCHKCDNRSCCNPKHLFVGTPADNTADMMAKGRNVRGELVRGSKLKEQDVKEIRMLRASGMKLKPIAERYGISCSNVVDIAKHQTWKHVP